MAEENNYTVTDYQDDNNNGKEYHRGRRQDEDYGTQGATEDEETEEEEKEKATATAGCGCRAFRRQKGRLHHSTECDDGGDKFETEETEQETGNDEPSATHRSGNRPEY